MNGVAVAVAVVGVVAIVLVVRQSRGGWGVAHSPVHLRTQCKSASGLLMILKRPIWVLLCCSQAMHGIKRKRGVGGATPPFASPIYVCITSSETAHRGSAFAGRIMFETSLRGLPWAAPTLKVHDEIETILLDGCS